MLAGFPQQWVSLGVCGLLQTPEVWVNSLSFSKGQLSLPACLSVFPCVCLSPLSPLPYVPTEQLPFLAPTVCYGCLHSSALRQPGAEQVLLCSPVVEGGVKLQREMACLVRGQAASESHLNPGIWCTEQGKVRCAWPSGVGFGCMTGGGSLASWNLGFLTCKVGQS